MSDYSGEYVFDTILPSSFSLESNSNSLINSTNNNSSENQNNNEIPNSEDNQIILIASVLDALGGITNLEW